MTLTNFPWQPIDTAPKVEFAKYIGYDTHAESWGEPEEGLCLITWMDEEDGFEAGWQVQPFSEGMDVVLDEETNITMWMPLSALLPGAPVGAA